MACWLTTSGGVLSHQGRCTRVCPSRYLRCTAWAPGPPRMEGSDAERPELMVHTHHACDTKPLRSGLATLEPGLSGAIRGYLGGIRLSFLQKHACLPPHPLFFVRSKGLSASLFGSNLFPAQQGRAWRHWGGTDHTHFKRPVDGLTECGGLRCLRVSFEAPLWKVGSCTRTGCSTVHHGVVSRGV
jgi:hypothetical protein